MLFHFYEGNEVLTLLLVLKPFLTFQRLFMDRSDDALLRKKFGDGIPSVTELSKQISMMFVNTHYSLTGPKPMPPTVIEIGGVHIKEPKAIDEVS